MATYRALQSYEQMDSSWASSRENHLLHEMLEAAERGDPKGCEDAIEAYNPGQYAMKKWNLDMLGRIKGQIEEKAEDFS